MVTTPNNRDMYLGHVSHHQGRPCGGASLEHQLGTEGSRVCGEDLQQRWQSAGARPQQCPEQPHMFPNSSAKWWTRIGTFCWGVISSNGFLEALS